MQLFGETRRKHKPRLEIVPMIDVMLLLLVFYILSTVNLHQRHGLPVQLPKVQTGASMPADEVVVTITRDARFYVNKTEIRREDLAQAVKRLAEQRPRGLAGLQETGLVINADLAVPHRLVVGTMDALRSIDITRFGIATEPEAARP